MTNKNILETSEHKIVKICNCKDYNKDTLGAYKIFFGTLVSESRLRIINLLRKKSMNVSEIINNLKLDQTSVSHDLQRLKRCGFVEAEIKGKFRHYKINEETILPLMKLIDEHMSNYCIHILNKNKSKGGEK